MKRTSDRSSNRSDKILRKARLGASFPFLAYRSVLGIAGLENPTGLMEYRPGGEGDVKDGPDAACIVEPACIR